MKRLHHMLRDAGGAFIVIASLVTVFSLAFLLTDFLYGLLGWRPPAYGVQVINSLLGILLFALFGIGFSHWMRKGKRHARVGILMTIINALDRVSHGDFSVHLDMQMDEHEAGVFGDLVNSVNRMTAQLGQMENMRQEFIANVSHEIQSPLTSIRGFARALQNDRLTPEERHHYLDIIDQESTRLGRITEDLLKLASLEQEHVRFEPKAYRLDRQIRSLVLVCEPQWAARGIEMDVRLDEVEITADEDLLSQVWLNLIHNSIKFTPDGGRVRIGLLQEGEQIEFSISDSGIGIAEEDLPHVFERFYKADRSRTHSNGGSGLGLAIARKIVELHHGTIRAESQAGAGATFRVLLERITPPV